MKMHGTAVKKVMALYVQQFLFEVSDTLNWK